jgi:hypothetical protein
MSEPTLPPPLVSIQLCSNRPDNFLRLLYNIEATATDPGAIEVCVKIDDFDEEMNACVRHAASRRRLRLRYISTPLPNGFFGLWRAMNEVFRASDPRAAFVVNFNDEMFFESKGWDDVLRAHLGFFPDGLFRLRTSRFRRRNYFDVWECGFAPETAAFTARRWLDVQGDWNPCTGPDSFQQMVAYYLARANWPGHRQFARDVPVEGIRIGGEGAFIGLEGTALAERMRGAVAAWFELMSPAIQMEAFRRARVIQAHIEAAEAGFAAITLEHDADARILTAQDPVTHRTLARYSYRLSATRIRAVNRWRRLFLDYYCGRGAGAIRPSARGLAQLALVHAPALRRTYLRLRPALVALRLKPPPPV